MKKISLPRILGKTLLYSFSTLIIIMLILPMVVIFPMSFTSSEFLSFPPPGYSLQWWIRYFSKPDWIQATLTSLLIGLVSTIISTFLGTLASFPLVRLKFRGKNLAYSLILMPMIIPSIIWAISEYFVFASLNLIGNWFIIALCHALVELPFVVVLVTAGLKAFDKNLENAAISLGAGRITTFRKITFPLIKSSIMSAALFSFMISFDELLVAKFLSGINAVTLPKRMWDGIRYELNPTITVASAMFLIFSLTVIAMIQSVKKLQKTN